MIYLLTLIRYGIFINFDMIWYNIFINFIKCVHIYTQTIYGTTQITNNVEECGQGPVFASFTLAFALQLRKKIPDFKIIGT
jgi:hypothetical protein